MKKANVAIIGYGNLGKGVENALKQNNDFELFGVFTRRPKEIKLSTQGAKVLDLSTILDYKGKIDMLFLCVGSANDLPKMGSDLIKHFNTIDSYDNHSNIPYYVNIMDKVAKENGKIAISSVGWDPGLFSLRRIVDEAILPKSETNCFWGRGVSQGHSNAVRGINGVKNGIQYTIPREDAVKEAMNGHCSYEGNAKHIRECFVVCDKTDEKHIEQEIKTMPAYFEGYETHVNFISEEEFNKNHLGKLNHGGQVITVGTHHNGEKSKISYTLDLESNPNFTANVMVAYARAGLKMHKEGHTGCKTVMDIAPVYLSNKPRSELMKKI